MWPFKRKTKKELLSSATELMPEKDRNNTEIFLVGSPPQYEIRCLKCGSVFYRWYADLQPRLYRTCTECGLTTFVVHEFIVTTNNRSHRPDYNEVLKRVQKKAGVYNGD